MPRGPQKSDYRSGEPIRHLQVHQHLDPARGQFQVRPEPVDGGHGQKHVRGRPLYKDSTGQRFTLPQGRWFE